jgi:uncharacterized protein
MKIRTITCFYDPLAPDPLVVQHLEELAQDAASRFQSAGYEVQTRRLSTTPFPTYLDVKDQKAVVESVQQMESEAKSHGFAYLSIGPASLQHPGSFDAILPILMSTRNVFASGQMTNTGEGVILPAVRACAGIIHDAATVTPDGFTNLRFSAIANVHPNGPFFPGSFHTGEQIGFAVGIECADAAVDAFKEAETLLQARAALIDRLEQVAADLNRAAMRISAQYTARFYGFDFSLAPYPEDWCSIGGAMERLGALQVGMHGSLAAAAILADTLDRGHWPRAGFNGLFMPVLEDSVLAKRAHESLTLKDLLLFSTVCGAGLDTVPLPGDVTPEAIAAVLLDVAALSLRLDKPLTARLMPVPGKTAGEMTSFDFSFFHNGRVLSLDTQPLTGWLAGDESFDLRLRKSVGS